MKSGKSHIISFVKRCNNATKLVLLVVLTGCISSAFAQTLEKTYTSGNQTITGNVETTNTGGKDYSIKNENTKVLVTGNLTISDKTKMELTAGASLIVEKDLTIGTNTGGTGAGGAGNEATLVIKGNSILVVKGDLILNDNAKLKINEGGEGGSGAIVYVEGNLIINGRDKNPSEVMAKNNAIMIVKGDLVLDAGTNKEGNPEGKIKVESGASITITGKISGTGKVEFPGRSENGGKGYFSVLGGIAEGENDIRFEIGELNKLSEELANSILYIEGVDNISVSGPGAEGGGSVSVSNQSNSSAYAQSISNIVTVPILLPIELVSFQVFKTIHLYIFNWVTASEVENDFYTLEYSADGIEFEEIDRCPGAGTTSEMSYYEYQWAEQTDEAQDLYFRLKQTDYNGDFSYSDVVYVASKKKPAGKTGSFRYGPLNLQIQDGELRYIQK